MFTLLAFAALLLTADVAPASPSEAPAQAAPQADDRNEFKLDVDAAPSPPLEATGAAESSVATEVSTGRIFGRVVNGSRNNEPLAGAEVVLRAGRGNSLQVIAKTTTDDQGQYEFVDLSLDSNQVFLPGVNWREIHYPGARTRLTAQQRSVATQLTAYESSAAPSPLIARRHELSLRVDDGRLEVTERLHIENPALVTYVGETRDDHPTVTLRLTLPAGFEKVTFEKEALAQHFVVRENVLFTDLPWTPGSREITFQYRLPIDRRSQRFARSLDLPTDEIQIRVAGHEASEIAAPGFARRELAADEVELTRAGEQLPAGFEASLSIGKLPVSWERYAPWLTLGALVVAIAITGAISLRRGSSNQVGSPAADESSTQQVAQKATRRTADRRRIASRHLRPKRVRSSSRS